MNINSYVGLALSILLVACGGGGGGGGSETPAPSTPPPTISFSANPTSVLVGSESTLTWSSSNASSCAASGAWSGSRPTSGSENVTITTVGDSSFTITCSGEGGSSSSIVTIEGFRQTDGVVVDGYITGADVFIDENANFIADATENSTTSDNEGKFTIKYADGNLVSLGGTDLDSQTLLDNLLITHKLAGHSEFKAITPVTSVAAFMQDASSINSTLGIDASIDIFTFDPVANKGDGGIYDYLYEKGNQLTVLAFALQNITNNINASTDTTQDYFKAISEEIEKEYNETLTKVDIETEAFVIKALENVIEAKSVAIDEAARANVSRALSGMLPIVQVKSTDNLTTSIIRFALSTLQTDIQAIANGSASAEIVTSYTEDLLNYIAQDQNIDSDEIAPDINAIADSAITSEDVEVQINVLLNDSFVTSAPFSLSATDGSNGSTSISNDLLLYSPDANFNGSDSFSYTLSQGDKTSSADVTVTIQPVNDEPSIDIASTIQVEENQTDVTTVSVSDVDNDELTLSLGGPDADSFNLSDENVLTFKEAPDYETKNSYSISLSLTDGIETVIRDVAIAIIDINEAPTMSLTQPENNEGDALYPLVLTNDENKFDINLSFSDPETPVSNLTVTATTTAGESISIFHEEGSNISTLDISSANAGPTDITISISDGEETVSDILKIWITRYVAIDNSSDPYSGNRAYTLLGNHSNENRKTNYVIISDAFPNEDRVDSFRSVLKTWVNLIDQTSATEILDNFFSIGVIETSLSNESAIGTAIGCDSRDPNIYCFEDAWKTALDSLQAQYFDDVDSRSVITGIDGRGVANPDWNVNIQNLLSNDSATVRECVYVLKHEFGHSYSLLGDEYTTTEAPCSQYNCSQIELYPNTTAEDEPEKVRWNHHIDDLTSIPGYHYQTTGEAIGYFKGVYFGADKGFRPSFATVMGTTPSQWIASGGDIPRELLWDKIGQESFAIKALILQGMHSISAAYDANNDVVVSHNFVDPSGIYEVEWYLNGEKVSNDSNTFLLQRKSSGYEHVSYRIKEKTQNILIVEDNILNFRDVYSGLFSPNPLYTCPGPLTSDPDYADASFCRNSLSIKWTNYPGLYHQYYFDDFDSLINSAEVSAWGLQYWYEYSGLGAMFGINWEAN